MSKELESLKELKHWKETNNEKGVVWLPLFAVEDIEKDLTELEQIKNASVSEALDWFRGFKNGMITDNAVCITKSYFDDKFPIIEQALLKSQELKNENSALLEENKDLYVELAFGEKQYKELIECNKNYGRVLEIIKEYQVDIWLLKQCDYENYIRIRKEAMVSVGQIIDENGTVFEDEITEEEFDFLKRCFDNENNK